MEKQDYDIFMDDRTVVTNRCLIDLLLCLQHEDPATWVEGGKEMTMGQIIQIKIDWMKRQASIFHQYREMLTDNLGDDKIVELIGERMTEFHEADSSDKMKWGYR